MLVHDWRYIIASVANYNWENSARLRKNRSNDYLQKKIYLIPETVASYILMEYHYWNYENSLN